MENNVKRGPGAPPRIAWDTIVLAEWQAMTDKEIAAALGCTPQAVYQHRKRHNLPRPNYVCKSADAIQVRLWLTDPLIARLKAAASVRGTNASALARELLECGLEVL